MRKFIKRALVVLTSFSMIVSMGSNVFASEDPIETIEVNGETYTITTIEDDAIRTVEVSDSKGNITVATYDKNNDEVYCNGEEVEFTEEITYAQPKVGTRAVDGAGSGSSTMYLLRSKTYTMTGEIAGVMASIASSFGANVLVSIGLQLSSWIIGKLSFSVRISEYRSTSKMASGSYKGKYKYWTNVLVRSGNLKTTYLNENHSVYYK